MVRADSRTHLIPLQSVSKIKSFSLLIIIKYMVEGSAFTVEFLLHLGGLLSAKET